MGKRDCVKGREGGFAIPSPRLLGCGAAGLIRGDPKYADSIVTITLLPDDTIAAWGKKPIALEEFIEKLRDYKNQTGSENVVIVVEADAKANYNTLRYVLDQLMRCGIQRIMVSPRAK